MKVARVALLTRILKGCCAKPIFEGAGQSTPATNVPLLDPCLGTEMIRLWLAKCISTAEHLTTRLLAWVNLGSWASLKREST